MIKILICDDHAIVRQGLKQIVEDCDDIKVKAEASSGEEVLKLILNTHFDVIILDITMEGISGIETLNEILRINPKIAVLMLSMHDEEQYALRVLKDGASGYLSKKSAPNELIKAIRTIASGKKYITDSISQQLLTNLTTQSDTPVHEKLSAREYEIFIKLASGKTVSEISDELHLSAKTISTYKTRIQEKTGLSNLAGIIKYAIRHQLIE